MRIPQLVTSVVLLALLPVLAGAADPAWPTPPHDAANASFWKRAEPLPPNPLAPPMSWYTPLARLAGQPAPFLANAAPGKQAFDSQTVDEAVSFAELNKSSALLVAHDGLMQIEHYGPTDPPDHLFSAHSMTRVLGAIAVGILVDRGTIRSIDTPASVYIREWRNDPRRAITIRQLLTMSSGLSAAFSTAPGSPYFQAYYGSDIRRIVANAPLAAAPGTTFAYDQHNNHALALIVERASGRKYLDFVSHEIWQKIGANDARMMLDHDGGRVMSFCCLIATPRDWLRVGELLRNDGVWNGHRIVSAAWVRQMRTPSAVNAHFGFQLFLGSAWLDPAINRQYAVQKDSLAPVRSDDAFYFSGAGDIHVMVLPDRHLTLVRTGDASPGWRYHVIPNLLLDALDGHSRASDWQALYAWRLGLPPTADATLSGGGLSYWPTARLAGAAQPKPLPRAAFSCDLAAQLAEIDAKLDKGGSYGLIVYQGGAVRHEHYAGKFNADTRGESASMHKSVMALLVGHAVADGKITSVDTPIATWLPEWAGDARGRITLKNLLQMASGLEPVPFEPSVGGKSSLLFRGTDMESLELSLQYKEPPGQVFEYFGHISELIALILQRATGEPYYAYMQRVLWQPLGAAEAFVALDRPGGLTRSYASLLARPEDWVRIGRVFLNDGMADGGRIVPASWIADMTAPSTANPNYGYQLWRGSPYAPERAYSTFNPIFKIKAAEPFLASDTVYFDGATGRRVYISRSEQLVIVRLGDADVSWDDSALPNAVIRALRRCPAVPANANPL